MSYKVVVSTNGGVVVAGGAVVAANLVNLALSGEAVVLVLRACKRSLSRHRSRDHGGSLLLRAAHDYLGTGKLHDH